MQTENENFDDIVSATTSRSCRFGYSPTAKNEHELEIDLAQQTFFIYAEKVHHCATIEVKSWLFTTLYREFLRRKRKDDRMDNYEPEKMLDAAGGSEEPQVRRSLDANLALEALRMLKVYTANPLSLFYLKDLYYKEISEVLDVPIGTIMSRLSRGKPSSARSSNARNPKRQHSENMERDEAKAILELCRRGILDDREDPMIAEALIPRNRRQTCVVRRHGPGDTRKLIEFSGDTPPI